jgi:hypothetical protein
MMPTKNPVNATEHTDHASSKPDKKKVQRGRVPTTRSQDRPKQNASRPAKHDASPLLASYASAKTSKSVDSLPPISPVYNKNKNKTKPSQHGEKKRKEPDLDSVTPSTLKSSLTAITGFPAPDNFSDKRRPTQK